MSKRTLYLAVALVVVAVVGYWFYSSYLAPPPPQMTREEFTDYWYGLAVDPSTLPDTITDEVLQNTSFQLPGLRGMDLSNKDMSGVSLDVLMLQTFDRNTTWPDAVPAGFAPDNWMKVAKDPGLGVRELHEQGITGAGVTVAVFDNPMDPEHEEYGDRITYHRVAAQGTSAKDWRLHPHGQATASILAGKTVGVAPETTIHYFARAGGKFQYHLQALREVIELNETLPEGQKIRIVSISSGFIEEDLPYQEDWEAAMEAATAAGITVFYSDNLGADLMHWGGCPPDLDRDDPANCRVANASIVASRPTLIVPGDYRTTASNTGPSDYAYYGEGGWSWGIPYVAGLAALAWQVDPDLNYDEFVELLWNTSTPTDDNLYVVNPAALLRAVAQRTGG